VALVSVWHTAIGTWFDIETRKAGRAKNMITQAPAMAMMEQGQPVMAVRIRFAGSDETETFHMTPSECKRFHTDWKSYLGGSHVRGGEYQSRESDHGVVIALNFAQIAYTEPGKVY